MKLHGIKIPHLKNTADCAPVRIPVPKTVTIPMSMHIGKPAEILVKRGDSVFDFVKTQIGKTVLREVKVKEILKLFTTFGSLEGGFESIKSILCKVICTAHNDFIAYGKFLESEV